MQLGRVGQLLLTSHPDVYCNGAVVGTVGRALGRPWGIAAGRECPFI